jgi:hypothetical protein
MNPATIFQLFATNGADIQAIIEKIGLGNVFKMVPSVSTLFGHFQTGGIAQILAVGGPEIQTIIETIGTPNIPALLPNLANIWKTLSSPPAA